MSKYTVAIVGVTGIVGSEVLKILGERNFPIKDLKLVASSRSEGTKIPFQGDNHIVHEATPDSFDNTDLVFIAAGSSTSKELAPEAAKRVHGHPRRERPPRRRDRRHLRRVGVCPRDALREVGPGESKPRP